MSSTSGLLLIVDYNLSRIDDVIHMRNYARDRYGAGTALIRANPTAIDAEICDEVIDLDPLRSDFAEVGAKLLGGRRGDFKAGIVFSDNAVESGAALLERLGLPVDSAELAAGAFCKYQYRLSEARYRALLEAQRLMVPDFTKVTSMDDLHAFAAKHPNGFVIKPMKEGNNRGVVLVRAGGDRRAAFAEVSPYLAGGVICEQIIPYRREYSFDGLGQSFFITEKISATGRYPVEVAQVLPARLTEKERTTIQRAGKQVNWLVGQCDGPFHNEIKLSDDGTRAAVVEPNRRPGGMKIWSLARWVYGIDFYHRWIDSAFGATPPLTLPEPLCSAATVMLGIQSDRVFSTDDLAAGAKPFEDAVAATADYYGLKSGELSIKEFAWLSTKRRQLHGVPRDNADFAAQACIVLNSTRIDIRDVVATLREKWLVALDNSYARVEQAASM
ncbi:acetyl-CoA carboxylase biotin carboxylase subunit family protein [Pendulispora albinea]|uniref:ATP-grasp domain-containing protein n=1 Tax=Pendulispora albinea TaxID=2741071 RepID=A0ABZ2LX37_9BACT